MKYFCDLSDLDDTEKYACDVCKEKTTAKQRRTLWKLPSVLCISLNRFIHMNKDVSNFELSDTIDLNDYCSNSQNPIIYDLQSMACHYGSMNRGHCISRIKEPNGRWIEINDDSISKWNGSTNGSEIYLLIYRKRI